MGRDKKSDGLNSSFLFPQMLGQKEGDPNWTPQFMDYLFLAFNTSTAFSPTDTGSALPAGAKVGDDAAVPDFVDDRGVAGGSRRKYSLGNRSF